ncbi:MAG TPA: hypothetical protein VHD60_01355 [Candidatus Saccharimonadales bacterium]|nr:hypothetical protein [Candidatus Saccharimonadales bacterium]
MAEIPSEPSSDDPIREALAAQQEAIAGHSAEEVDKLNLWLLDYVNRTASSGYVPRSPATYLSPEDHMRLELEAQKQAFQSGNQEQLERANRRITNIRKHIDEQRQE